MSVSRDLRQAVDAVPAEKLRQWQKETLRAVLDSGKLEGDVTGEESTLKTLCGFYAGYLPSARAGVITMQTALVCNLAHLITYHTHNQPVLLLLLRGTHRLLDRLHATGSYHGDITGGNIVWCFESMAFRFCDAESLNVTNQGVKKRFKSKTEGMNPMLEDNLALIMTFIRLLKTPETGNYNFVENDVVKHLCTPSDALRVWSMLNGVLKSKDQLVGELGRMYQNAHSIQYPPVTGTPITNTRVLKSGKKRQSTPTRWSGSRTGVTPKKLAF